MRNIDKIIVFSHVNGDDSSYCIMMSKTHLNMTEMLLHLSADIDDFSCCGDYEQETSAINQMLLWFEKKVLIITVDLY